jgi:uncharacterized protein (TIGR02284 family)
MNNSKIVEGLNELLAKNYDAEKGFKEVANKTDSAALATLFRVKASQRYDFGHDIKNMISSLGGEVSKGTSTLGDMHRAWINFKTIFSLNKEESILNEIETGEEAAIREYNKFLENRDLPEFVRIKITSQRNAIKRTLKRVEVLEEVYE